MALALPPPVLDGPRDERQRGFPRRRTYSKGLSGERRTIQAKASHCIQAFQWFQKAAEQGYVAAQFSLGVMYDAGRGVA
jgi:TPR repeat protein